MACRCEEGSEDIFKRDFKFYKRRKPPPDLSEVLDFGVSQNPQIKNIQLSLPGIHHLTCLKPLEDWKVYTYEGFPGFTFIKNPFLDTHQSYWVKRCLEDYPVKPNLTNLDVHMNIDSKFNIWHESIRQRSGTNSFASTILHKLRWATLGYHHDWNTKKYSSENMTPLPKDMRMLSEYISTCLNWPRYKAEAAIVNYYHLDSTLAGHTDHSELDHQSPLLSISFGQTALFMLGGPTRETKPITMFLHSGDVAVMEGPARLSYHAVPKILTDSCDVRKFMVKKSSDHSASSTDCKREFHSGDTLTEATLSLNREIDQVLGDIDDTDFWEYLKTSRINMNIRQVVPGGESFPGSTNDMPFNNPD